MTALAERPLGHLYLALVAAGAVVGALTAAGSCLVEAVLGRRA